MKKILLIVLLLIPFYIYAESAKVVSIVPRCSYITNNKTIIPIEVISQNEGNISTLLNKYLLGNIYNEDISINIINKSSSYDIDIDSNKDSNGYSDIYFSPKNNKKDIKYKELDKVLEFELEIIFNKTIPNTIHILNTEIVLSKNKNSCSKLNNYNVSNINNKMLCLNNNNYSYIMIIGVLIIIIIVLWKRSNKNAIHKTKNK